VTQPASNSTTFKKPQLTTHKTTTVNLNMRPATQPAGHVNTEEWVSMEMFQAVVERLETLQQSYQSLQEERQENLQQMADAITKLADRLYKNTTVISSMDNHLIDTSRRVTALETSIKSLQHAAATTASWKSTMEAGTKKMADQLSRGTSGEGATNNQRDTSDSSFFIGGMYILRDWYGDRYADPAEIVSCILKQTHLICSVEKMTLADKAAREKGSRLAARAMIVTMRSPMMKKEAIIQIKGWLAREGIRRGVTVCDSFSAEVQSNVRSMGRYADQKKKEGLFFQYRVINKDGAALLQTKEKKRDSYRDRTVSEHQTSKNPPPQLPSSTSTSNQSNSNQQQTNNSRPASPQSGAAGQLPTATTYKEEYYQSDYYKNFAAKQQLIADRLMQMERKAEREQHHLEFMQMERKAEREQHHLEFLQMNGEIPMNG